MSNPCGEMEMCDLLQGKCVCNSNFVYSKTKKTCVSLNRLHHPCSTYHQCGPSEMCSGGKCACKKGYYFCVGKQMCDRPNCGGEIPATTPKSATTTAGPKVVTMAHNQGPVMAPPANKTAVIAGAVVGGVVFIVLVSLFAFFMIRRARRPYENREMLLSEDSDGIM